MQIPLLRPTMRRRYMHSVLTQLVEEDIGPGKTTKEFVAALSAYVGAAGGVALSSPYVAVALAAEVAGARRGDRVAISALAPSVYLDVLRDRGIEPVVLDADASTCIVPRAALAACVSGGVKAVFAHHTCGLLAPYEAATEAGVPVVEDATASLAPAQAEEEGLLPALADLAVIFLGPDGLVSAGSGAALVSRKRSFVTELKSAAGNAAVHAQLPNIGAALALAQLADLDTDRVRRLEIVTQYRSALAKSRHHPLLGQGEGGTPVSSFVVRLTDSLGEVRQYARKHDVETRPAFEDTCVAASEQLAEACPAARKLLLCCLEFPLYPMLGRKNVESICRVLATLP
jgi:dTDP-4-amino-4,6-dideoxygalactose transaminase